MPIPQSQQPRDLSGAAAETSSACRSTIAGLSLAPRPRVEPRLGALLGRPSVHFSLSYTLFAALTMNRHFDLFRCESGFARQRPLSQMPAPNVTSEKHLQRGSKRHSKQGTDDSTNDQAPDKDRHNYG